MRNIILNELTESRLVLDNFLNNSDEIKNIETAAQMMSDAIVANHKIISCGNGGSMSDAMHFAEELTGRYRQNRKAIPAISISDPTHISCTANDYGYDFVFSRYIEALGQEGDVLLAISTSGNSANVLQAAHAARSKGMKVVALTGKNGGKLAELADCEIRVAHSGFADRIQEVHIKIIHILIEMIERKFFPENY